MARYPNWGVGMDVSAQNLADGIPDIYKKVSGEDRTSTTTLANDAELTGIALPVGSYWIRLLLLWITFTSATPDIKTQWAFTGTWNNPTRACCGPAASNTAAASAVTPMQLNGITTNVNATYGTAAGSTFYVATEETFDAVVSVAGNMSLQWAQNTLDASITSVKAGSAFTVKRLA